MGQISLVSFVSHGLWSIKREQLMVHQINFYLGPDLPLVYLLPTIPLPLSVGTEFGKPSSDVTYFQKADIDPISEM